MSKAKCDPKEIALKAYFLGPMAENGNSIHSWISESLTRWMEWRKSRYPEDGSAISLDDQEDKEFLKSQAQINLKMKELIERYQEEIPSFSPRYMGHMISEISIPALMGHWVALLQNPNNVASEASRVGIQIEREAINDLCKMVGWDSQKSLGHFTSGGSIANIEAIFRAREWFSKFFPNEFGVVMVPRHRHYSWLKAARLLGMPKTSLWQIELDENGRLDVADLKLKLTQAKTENKKVMLVVSVMGSTELGTLDPIEQVNETLKNSDSEYQPWHHVDAAYGGFFCAIDPLATEANLNELNHAKQALKNVDSITLDPHKLAYVPYSCGAFICKDDQKYFVTQVSAPYLEHDQESDRGLFTIEGSRPATGASATWMVSKTMGFNDQGLGRILRRTLSYREEFKNEITKHLEDAYVIQAGLSNILGLVIAKKGEDLKRTNARTLFLYESFSPQKEPPFILSKTSLAVVDYSKLIQKNLNRWDGISNQDELMVLRFCLMNPFLKSREMNRDFFKMVCDLLRAKAQEFKI